MALTSPETPSTLLRIGRILFALCFVASGIYQLATGLFMNLVPVNPAHLPPAWMAYVFGVVLIVAGIGLLVRQTVVVAASTLSLLMLVLLFGFGLRVALANASVGFVWVDPLMILALLGGVCLAVAPGDTPEGAVERVFDKGTRFVALALGAFLAYCGALHFPYATYVADMVPSWIPGHLFWTYFAAVALIAGGVGLLVPGTARLAAILSGMMLCSWLFLVHLPLAFSLHKVSEVSRGVVAFQDGAVALMLAGSLRPRRR